MDYRATVCELIAGMLADAHRAGMDRHEVAAVASRLTGKDVTKNMLDSYTAPAREDFNCPLWLAPVLEVVCKATSLASWHAGIHGGRLTVGAETIDAEIGRLMSERDSTDARLKELKDLRRRVR
ncbi:hypothetical protein [Dyella terrae]|uniref:hypothetical protein n=1 Tax=Dyella terrae TaxID=522259 RepID=UPI001EFE7535|nr:hypothetical protein [Dyella terrae]